MSSVLIVDDSLTVRMDLEDAFRTGGLETRACETLDAARQALTAERFDLIVLDVLLPDGDGVDLLREIRTSDHADAFVMMLSTESEIGSRVRGIGTGADEYVGKPYERGYVVSRALELLRRAQPKSSAKGVLLIDDSPTFREHLGRALRDQDYEVATAATGEEGLRLASDLRPALILVDGELPDIDGRTVIRRIRIDPALRRTPCILLTGSDQLGIELDSLEAGADAFLTKSADTALLLARLSAVLRAAGGMTNGSEGPSLLGPKRVLAVDDSATYLHELGAALRGDGYDVVLATSGEEALELLAIQEVDCILLDLLMPGLGGRETCARIKGSPALRNVPLIVLTSMEEEDSMIESLAAGADDYITKATDFGVLKARVRAQIRRRQFEDENRQFRERILQMELEAAETRAARELAAARAALLQDLEKKNKELESFSYSVSHDLRAPLRAINAFARILLKDHGHSLSDEGRRVTWVIRDNAVRMGELIDDLLDFSRMARKSLHMREVDMNQLVGGILDELAPTWGEREVRLVVPELPAATADESLLRQVWINYVSNAVKYTQPHGKATIEVLGRAEDERLVYGVRDDGVGFDMAHAQKLFGVFQRLHADTEFEGTGIGLALAGRIVDRHGGSVWAEGAVGEGATFWFSLPRQAS